MQFTNLKNRESLRRGKLIGALDTPKYIFPFILIRNAEKWAEHRTAKPFNGKGALFLPGYQSRSQENANELTKTQLTRTLSAMEISLELNWAAREYKKHKTNSKTKIQLQS